MRPAAVVALLVVWMAALSGLGQGLQSPSWVGSLSRRATALACTETITQALDEDYWALSDDYSQRLNITADTTVCQVTLRIYQSAGAGDVYVEFRDGPDPAASSRYGDASITRTISSSTITNEETFTWSTRPTIPSGSACYLHIRRISGTHRFRACNETGGVGYQNTTYALYTDAGVLGSGTWDLWMKVETQ